MPVLSGRLAFLTLSVAAHTTLYVALGSPAAGRGGEETTLQQTATVTATLIPSELSVPEQETQSHPKSAAVPESSPRPDNDSSPAQAKNISEQTSSDPAGAGESESEGGGAMLPVLPPAEPHYFSLRELTQQPQIEKDLPSGKMVSLPETAPRTVIMHLLINERGEVDKVELEDASSLPASMAQTLEDSFSHLTFQPGRQGELAVKTRMKIEVSLDEIFHIGQASASPPAN
jgi:hypothetical protein